MAKKRDASEYFQQAPFDKTAFGKAYGAAFSGVPKYSAASIPDLVQMLGMMEQDANVTDLRWMAYMLATTFVESSSTVRVERQSKNRKGHVVTRAVKVWRNFVPTEEKGYGAALAYGKPVKVKELSDGSARVTEYDGQQWTVSIGGAVTAITAFAKRGVNPHTTASPDYVKDDGIENRYYGRGFVQLTWWTNYVATGVLLHRGLDLLFEPDLVEDPQLAYEIISTGMRTGKGFANGHTFTRYFHGEHTDYVHARAMVNGRSGEHEVAALAERFERVLFASRIGPGKIAER